MSNSSTSLTGDERVALRTHWNLADAHTRQSPSGAERTVLGALAEVFDAAAQADYFDLERASADAFLGALGQSRGDQRAVAVYASSIAMMVVARLVRARGYQAQLTCPTFDNLHALLVGEGVPVRPRRERQDPSDPIELLPACRVVVEVTPNNPTGSYLGARELTDLAAACTRDGRILVLDQSFKGQVDSCAAIDHYAILRQSGVSYVVIEDTGKLWPTLDIKVAYLLCSSDLQSEVEAIVDDILLNVSPFHLELVRRYSALSEKDSWRSVRGTIARNRQTLRQRLRESYMGVSPRYPESQVGVEVVELWPEICDAWCDHLQAAGVAVLDARKFDWASQGKDGVPLMRISLARDDAYFTAAVNTALASLGELRNLPDPR